MDASKVFSGLGIAAASYLILRIFRFTYLYLRPSSLERYHYGNNPWALVTGASDGIGYGFAQELAANGFNVLLHGRNPPKLEKGRSELAEEFPNSNFRIIVADASHPSEQQIKDVISEMKGLHLTLLINNVGGGSISKPLSDHTFEELDTLINLNARFPIQLTRAMIPYLSRINDPALIINIGSLGVDSGVPYGVPYGASKAFNMTMSYSLEFELRAEGKNIEVLGIPVGMVTDVAHKKEPSTFFTPGARSMARAALARVGCGKPIVIGYFGHAVQKFALDLMPASVRESLVLPTMRAYKEEYEKLR